MLGCDFGFADCAFETGIGVFEDVEAAVHVIVAVVVAFDGQAGEGAGDEEEERCEGGELHRE